MLRIDTTTQLCAVIGNPVGHSLSPAIHNAAFEATGLNYVYVAFEVEDVGACLSGMRAMPSFRGMSVTIPHKMAVMEHLDAIDPLALKVGSVNTIVNEDGQLRGYTTDGPGTLRAFEEAGVALEGKRVLFLGSGGAVRAVAFAMAGEPGVERVTILGRTPSRVQDLAIDLAAKTPADVRTGSLIDDLDSAVADHDILVQGTPVGMYPERMDETLVPASLLRADHVVFDMVYRPLGTRLLREAEQADCRTIPGIEMLVNQALLQFEYWTAVPAPADVMRRVLMEQFGSETPGH
ncbi:MAG: shikimate dehydrogenase [Nitrospiraceae bacterium]|nr:shikimate dehydrogenase [Nitrospiraceae bacterium]